MERAARSFCTLAFIFGIHQPSGKELIGPKIYSFCLLTTFSIITAVYVREEYSNISIRADFTGVGQVLITLFIFLLELLSCVKLILSLYWVLNKSKEFFKIVVLLENVAVLLKCEKTVYKEQRRLDKIASFCVFPALLALTCSEFFTYGASLQLLENCFGCVICLIWIWKYIFLASTTKLLFTELNLIITVSCTGRKPDYIIIEEINFQNTQFLAVTAAVEMMFKLRRIHADICTLLSNISDHLQFILIVSVINIFLYTIYCTYYLVNAVFNLEPRYADRRLVISLGTSGWVAFYIANTFFLALQGHQSIQKVMMPFYPREKIIFHICS